MHRLIVVFLDRLAVWPDGTSLCSALSLTEVLQLDNDLSDWTTLLLNRFILTGHLYYELMLFTMAPRSPTIEDPPSLEGIREEYIASRCVFQATYNPTEKAQIPRSERASPAAHTSRCWTPEDPGREQNPRATGVYKTAKAPKAIAEYDASRRGHKSRGLRSALQSTKQGRRVL